MNHQDYIGAKNVIAHGEGIRQLVIPTTDLEGSAEFFTSFFNYARVSPLERSPQARVTLRAPNQFSIHLEPVNDQDVRGSSNMIISVTVRDFDERKAKLEALNLMIGAETFDDETQQRTALFKAPDGHVFQLSSLEDTAEGALNESTSYTTLPTAADLFNALGHCGVEWILTPTHSFVAMIEVFTQVMGYPMITQGVPQTEMHYSQYALLATPSGVTLEIVEINEDNPGRFNAPLPSFTVRDLNEAVSSLERRDDTELLTGIMGSAQWGWLYIRISGEVVCQIQGPRASVD